MIKKILLINTLIISLFILMSGCGKEEEPATPMVGSPAGSLEEGLWINDDTFRISARGVIKEEHTGKSPLIRQEMACTAARLVAMHKIMTAFSGSKTDAVTSEKKEGGSFSGTIRNGKVVEKTFSKDTNTCEIVYEISNPGLKKSMAQ